MSEAFGISALGELLRCIAVTIGGETAILIWLQKPCVAGRSLAEDYLLVGRLGDTATVSIEIWIR